MRKQNEGYGERQLINKLYDGASCWIVISADHFKNALSIPGFAQPQPFIDMYRPLARICDGFVDQLLVCTIKRKMLLEEEVDELANKLDQHSLQSFNSKSF